jgi:hypothetical protein
MDTQLIIDNQYVPASNGSTFTREHPVTSKVVTTAAAGTVQDVVKAADSAAAAFKSWSQTSPSGEGGGAGVRRIRAWRRHAGNDLRHGHARHADL